MLRRLDKVSDPDEAARLVRIERAIWECVNRERYGAYQTVWKEFYREWRSEENWRWPTDEPFVRQHERLADAARTHGLPRDPIGGIGKANLLAKALHRAAVRTGASPDEIAALCPPASELLP